MAKKGDKDKKPATTHVMSREQRANAYSEAIKLWPVRIDTSEKTYLPDNGCHIPSLSDAWNKAEMLLEKDKYEIGQNEFEEIMTAHWLVFICLHAIAYSKEVLFVLPRELTFAQIDDIYENGHPTLEQ